MTALPGLLCNLQQAPANEHFKTDCLTLATLIKLVCLPEPLSLAAAFKVCEGCGGSPYLWKSACCFSFRLPKWGTAE